MNPASGTPQGTDRARSADTARAIRMNGFSRKPASPAHTLYDVATEETNARRSRNSGRLTDSGRATGMRRIPTSRRASRSAATCERLDAGAAPQGRSDSSAEEMDVEVWSNTDPLMIEWLNAVHLSVVRTALLSNMHNDMIARVRNSFPWISYFRLHGLLL